MFLALDHATLDTLHTLSRRARTRALPELHYHDPLCTHNNDPNISAGSPIE
jgi:hypothetical protein